MAPEQPLRAWLRFGSESGELFPEILPFLRPNLFYAELPHTWVEQSARAQPIQVMAAFYARYVPPSMVAQKSEPYDQSSSKRKHEDDHQNSEGNQKRAKTETGNKAGRLAQKQPHSSSIDFTTGPLGIPHRQEGEDSIRPKKSHSGKPDGEGQEVLAKYSVVKVAEKSDGANNSRQKNERGGSGALELDPPTAEAPAAKRATKKRKKDDKQDGGTITGYENQLAVHADEAQPIDGLSDQRHAGVRQKFEASKAKARMSASSMDAKDGKKQGHGHSEDTNEEQNAAETLHGLEPLPQPPQAEPSTELPTYSALSGWMATPLRVQSSFTTDFKNLSLEKQLISNLQAKGLTKAFAIQAAVLPLLSKGNSRHKGDICISAATGSGKTLAYVLPLVQALKDLVGTKLRGLIVVPTRELVAQVREVCEVCAAGTSLRIATALGSKALKDEQKILIEQHTVYNPEQYKREREKPIEWSTFGLEDILAQSDEDTPTTNYVKRFSSKVDVLITTPGRLVDHLRSTPGFNLDDIQWLIIDEADRLLNESFQEWIEVVMPALKSDAATRSRDELLRELRLEVPERNVQKVILSATMTQDISKLNSLDLQNPKLVVVGDLPKPQTANEDGAAVEDTEFVPDANGTFNLPPTLTEFAVSVGDCSKKPLYLLKLLNSHILRPPEQRNGLVESSSKTTPSRAGSGIPNATEPDSDDTSSSDSSDTTDSDSSSYVSDSDSSSFTTPRATTRLTQTVLIFARSTEAATRLSRLLSLLSPSLAPRLGVLTKSTNSSISRKTLSHFRQGKTTLLVATDRASRGLDLTGLAHVVSYDVPPSATTYIHRVGRTARAGKEGKAWTLVGHREARWFWNEIGKSKRHGASGEVRVGRGNRKVKRVNIDIGGDVNKEVSMKTYENALRVLGEEVRGNQ
jgi:ATP-dependent RNA helicase DDX51/DBP6